MPIYMAYKYNYGGSDEYDDEKMAYDLRQIYAKIVGNHLAEISMYRRERNFYEWFEALEDLYTITRHKFREYEEDEQDKKTYKQLRNEVIQLSNQYKDVWLKKSNEAVALSKIIKALRDIEEWLFFKMNESNMFGKMEDLEGL